MDFEQDYFMRIISDVIRMIKKLITGDTGAIYELPEDENYTSCDDTYVEIQRLANAGFINEAENTLYKRLEEDNKRYLLMGLHFYEHLNTFTDDFLLEHDYSREEIQQGISSLAEQYHIQGLANVTALLPH